MSSYTNLPLIDAFEAQRMVYKARYSDSKNKSTIILSQKPLFFTILNDVSDKNIIFASLEIMVKDITR